MKRLLLMALMICSTGCLTYKAKPPLPEKVKLLTYEVSKRPYELHIYDCTNFSYDLMQLLRIYSYDARIIRYTPKRKSGLILGHALVELIYEDFAYYIDATKPLGRELVGKPTAVIEQIYTIEVFELAEDRAWLDMVKEDYKGHIDSAIERR